MSFSSFVWRTGNGRSNTAKRPRAASLDWYKGKPSPFAEPKRSRSENSYFKQLLNFVGAERSSNDKETVLTRKDYRRFLIYSDIFSNSDGCLEDHRDTRLREKAEECNEELNKLSISSAQEASLLERSSKLIDDIKQGPLIAARNADVPDDEKDKLRRCFTSSDSDHTIVINKFSVEMTRSKISCLRPSTWLNDEAINFYMLMLMDRDEKLTAAAGGEKIRRLSHYFNSFFIAKMLENDKYTYANIKRWTKKIDVFEREKIFMPINIRNTHWTMAVVFVQKKEIHYYDSMSGNGRVYLNSILQWLEDEAREKKGFTLDKTEWKLIDKERHVPQQSNGVDCGVFSIVCADFLSDDLPLSYTQSEIPDYRVKIGCAILRGNITY